MPSRFLLGMPFLLRSRFNFWRVLLDVDDRSWNRTLRRPITCQGLLEAKKVKFGKLTRGLLITGSLAFIGCAADDVSVHGSYYEDRHVYRREYAPPRPVEEADSSVSVRVDDRDAPRSRYDDDNSAPQYDSGDRVSADVVDEPLDDNDATYFEDDLRPYGE